MLSGSWPTAISHLLPAVDAPRVSIRKPARREVYRREQWSLRHGPGAALTQHPIDARDDYRNRRYHQQQSFADLARGEPPASSNAHSRASPLQRPHPSGLKPGWDAPTRGISSVRYARVEAGRGPPRRYRDPQCWVLNFINWGLICVER